MIVAGVGARLAGLFAGACAVVGIKGRNGILALTWDGLFTHLSTANFGRT
jgi:DNA gyrase inhibitor GyrI